MKKININIFRILILGLFSVSQLICASSFSRDRLSEACIDYIVDSYDSGSEVYLLTSISNQAFEEDDVIAKVSLEKGTNYSGSCLLEFYTDEILLKRLEVLYKVKLYKLVSVAAKGLQKGTCIQSSDISKLKVDISLYDENELIHEEYITGKKLTKSISRGTILLTSLFDSGNSIVRGDRVPVEVQSGAVRIRAYGNALNDARAGESVKIKVQERILQGIASDEGSVVIK